MTLKSTSRILSLLVIAIISIAWCETSSVSRLTATEEVNLLENGGLEEWIPLTYPFDMPKG